MTAVAAAPAYSVRDGSVPAAVTRGVQRTEPTGVVFSSVTSVVKSSAVP